MAAIGKTLLDPGWLAARSTEVDVDGVHLSTTNPPSLGSKFPWMEAVVPGTVLGTLVKNKAVPDPFYGLENEAITDIADSGRDYYTFWFFTRFQCKRLLNQHVHLNFRAINYSAEVYINGHKTVLPKGMFRRHTLDVTDILNPENNLLAVIVHPPDHPGTIPPEGGQGGDHEIGKDVAAQYVEGWDWICPIRDRNTGIWDEVSISVTGPVRIVDPHLVSTFFDDYERAYLHVTAELENKSTWSTECSVNIQVTAELENGVCLVEHLQTENVLIPAQGHILHTFKPLFFYKPELWWPNGMGKQNLYDVSITVGVKGFGESDSWMQPFGFRKIESDIDIVTGGRLFKINGEPIFIRGGNWILSDGLLRLSKERYRTDIKFHADMNMNMIRCWGGGLAERPDFYHFCDIYGLLVWQEFWITGDVDGRGVPVSNPNGPLDHDLFLLCARDTVKLLRNHPSLALWVGGNEQVPPKDINEALMRDLRLHPYFKTQLLSDQDSDPSVYLDGTRDYIQGSMWDGFADGKGNFSDGPYEIQYPEDFFKDTFYKFGFNPEVGSVGMPVADTIRATMPPEGWEIPLFKKGSDGFVEEVPNRMWDYHKYIPYSKPGKVHDQILMYGAPENLDDFCLKAQLVNYIQYRALLEGWSSRMWTKYTGVLIWKNQNPWTGLRGQFYDHLLDQTASFYGCRSAAEPVHVQLNLATYFVEVVNTTSKELSDVAIEVSVWDLDGNCPYSKVFKKVSALPKKVVQISEFKYPKTENAKPVHFLLLKLYNVSDKTVISRNFYWLHLPGQDYTQLEPYRKKQIPLKITCNAVMIGPTYELEINVHNTSKVDVAKNVIQEDEKGDLGLLQKLFSRNSVSADSNRGLKVVEVKGSDRGVAFFLRFSVHNTETEKQDTRILPVHYSDNYFSLVPGESMSLKISFAAPAGIKKSPRVMLRGWNYPHGFTVFG
ncbi:Mannosylglycoprotein endo-beta-mannosidase [Cardamine amara subsp. amara]|uniref:Mannosylglycoprotein endo-beta-mannosidase n=1 Tax=Cardamine amara subsp. amara TaxID=228776 RepID=A0ABD0ZXJ6_CARAN